ncbi:MAG: SGNH/GDSL hydrolase family protein [Paludibacter sp.]
MKIKIVHLLLFFTLILQAQEKSFFRAGERVCFVGNSITSNAEFYHDILLFQLTRFPQQSISFFNCGISGNETQDIINRLDDDIFIHKPTTVVIMIGMNDVKRDLYGQNPSTNLDTLSLREKAIVLYKINLEKIINTFLSKNIKVILQKPSIYDQTAILPKANNLGVNDALKTCADFVGELSKKYKLPTVDYWTIMTDLNQKMQKVNPSATLIGSDRVHPGSVGHLVMAYQFLKTEKAPRYVSKIVISKNTRESTRKSENCEIKSVSIEKNKATFAAKENSLPFPIVMSQVEALTLIPFVDEMNVELLQVRGLIDGNYKLSIDGELVGSFSNKQLKEGVNLANIINTLQYKQAMKVRDVLWELRAVVAKSRTLKFIEYNADFKRCPNKADLSVVEVYMDSVFSTVQYKNPYFKGQLKNYLIDKPKEKELENSANLLREKAKQLVQPTAHNYTIEP